MTPTNLGVDRCSTDSTDPQLHDQSGSQQIDFSVLLASSIHDIKNALGYILNTLDFALQSETGELVCPSEQVVELNQEAKKANKVLVQLLTLYRMDRDQYSLNTAPVEVRDFLEDCFLCHEPLLRRKGLEMEIEADPQLVADFDRFLLEGAMENLIINASRFARTRLRLAAAVHEEMLELHVQDDGPGFPPEVVALGRGDAAPVPGESPSERRRPGRFVGGETKLGLYFCDVVASAHCRHGRRGDLQVASGGLLGGGDVRIRLPL
ncbi:hypothetical protein CKO15_04350 [Halorhodospira abdelmalekii]|uniref:sensor histidine kinase n=1 Tax=Halorhodospira abdelmalekii TaxID=421629 RepID=UPI001907938A|nr:HAMP domain-containing sensor histidine kinase [Halorhodospira abdelmalekii]MBK1734528.1 hypothetical protein [Halorhodospira abdelmalekii]